MASGPCQALFLPANPRECAGRDPALRAHHVYRMAGWNAVGTEDGQLRYLKRAESVGSDPYSALSDTVGSTRTARHAGRTHATNVASATTTNAAAKTPASVAGV